MKKLDGFMKRDGTSYMSCLFYILVLPNEMLILNFPLDKIENHAIL